MNQFFIIDGSTIDNQMTAILVLGIRTPNCNIRNYYNNSYCISHRTLMHEHTHSQSCSLLLMHARLL